MDNEIAEEFKKAAFSLAKVCHVIVPDHRSDGTLSEHAEQLAKAALRRLDEIPAITRRTKHDTAQERSDALMRLYTTRDLATALAHAELELLELKDAASRARRYDLSAAHQRAAFAERLHERLGQLKFRPASADELHSVIEDVFDATHTDPLPVDTAPSQQDEWKRRALMAEATLDRLRDAGVFVDGEAADRLMELIENPPPPNPAMVAALKEHRDRDRPARDTSAMADIIAASPSTGKLAIDMSGVELLTAFIAGSFDAGVCLEINRRLHGGRTR